jgi:hypothetical protein
MHSRALPTICLWPTGNFQGGYNFLNLVSGYVIKQRALHELPAPDSIIDRVMALAATSGVSSNLVFTDRCQVPFSWSNNEVEPPPVHLTQMFLLSFRGWHSNDIFQLHLSHQPYQTRLGTVSGWCSRERKCGVYWTSTSSTRSYQYWQLRGHTYPVNIPNTTPTTTWTTCCFPTSFGKAATSPTSSQYPSRVHRPPQHLAQDYLFTTVAKEHKQPPEHPNQTAGRTVINLAIEDECMMAQVCHYVMTHTANSLYCTQNIKPKKKRYSL